MTDTNPLSERRLEEIRRWLRDETDLDPGVGQDELASIATELQSARKLIPPVETSPNDARDAARYRYLRERLACDRLAARKLVITTEGGREPYRTLREAELDREIDECIGSSVEPTALPHASAALKDFMAHLGEIMSMEDGATPADYLQRARDIREWCHDHQTLPKLEYSEHCGCCARNKITVEVFARPVTEAPREPTAFQDFVASLPENGSEKQT